MIVALASALLLTAPAQSDYTPEAMGRASLFAGMCSSIGWVSSQEQVMAEAEAYVARHPELGDERIATRVGAGIEAAKVELDGIITAYRASRDVPTLKTSLRAVCDGIVRDMPAFLGRNADTDSQSDARIATIAAGL